MSSRNKMLANRDELFKAIDTWLLNPFSNSYDLAVDCFKVAGIKFNNSDVFALAQVLEGGLADGQRASGLTDLVISIFRENY